MKISPLTEQVLRASQPNPTDFPDRWKVEGLRMVDGDAEEFEIELRGTAFDIGLDMDEATARSIAALPKLLGLVQRLAEWDRKWPKWSDSNGTSEKEMNQLCLDAHAILENR